jgi:DNA polymerase-3 subunit alpha
MGTIGQALLADDLETAYRWAEEYSEAFPDFSLELQLFGDKDQRKVNKGLILLSNELKIPCIVTNDCHYAEPEDFEGQKIQLLMSSKGTINNPQGLVFESDQLWYKSEQEMDRSWDKTNNDIIPWDLYNRAKEETGILAESCSNVELDTSPKLPVIEGAEDKLIALCMEGLNKRQHMGDHVYQDRLLKELKLIFEKGFTSYFLIQRAIVDKARELGSSVGPGRGSGGGSIVCYLLEITDVDPIKFDLLFERFINPARGGKFARLQFTE